MNNLFFREITLKQFEEVISRVVRKELSGQKQEVSEKDDLIYGIRGLAGFLKCSLVKAQQIKNDNPQIVYHIGRKVAFRKREVLEAIKMKTK